MTKKVCQCCSVRFPFFIAIIDKIFKIIAILSVDNIGWQVAPYCSVTLNLMCIMYVGFNDCTVFCVLGYL